jgi:hypothetical protein
MTDAEYVPPTDLVDPEIAVSDCTALPLFVPFFGPSGCGGFLGTADVEAARNNPTRARDPSDPVIALDNVDRAIKQFFKDKTLEACEHAFYYVLLAARLLGQSAVDQGLSTTWLACAGTRDIKGKSGPAAALLYYDAVGLALTAGYMKAAVPVGSRRNDYSDGKTWFHTAYNIIYHVFLPNGTRPLRDDVYRSIATLQENDIIPDVVGFELLLDAAYIGMSFERHCVQKFGLLDSANKGSTFSTICAWFSAKPEDRATMSSAETEPVWKQMTALFTLRESCNAWIERAMAHIKPPSSSSSSAAAAAAEGRPRAGFLLHSLAWTVRLGFTAEIIYAAYGVYANRMLPKTMAYPQELMDANGRYFCETYVLAIRKHAFYPFYKTAGSIPPIAVDVPEDVLWPAEVTLSFSDWYTYHPLLDQAEMAYLVWVIRLCTEFSRELIACALQLESAVAAMHESFCSASPASKPNYETVIARYVATRVLRSGEVKHIAINADRQISDSLVGVGTVPAAKPPEESSDSIVESD